MARKHTVFARFGLSLLLTASVTAAIRPAEQSLRKGTAAAPIPSDDKTIAHLLNRIAYGPRPGDIDRVRQMGVAAYIDQQLHPEQVRDAAMDERLAGFDTLALSSAELARDYFMPAQMAQRQRQLQQGQATSGTPPTRPAQAGPERQKAQRVIEELNEQKILRAVYSERQLQEVLTDFWFNHFNVFAGKGQDRIYMTSYERDVIRPHVFGTFRDLLEATAKSPAMLFYLDNWMSSDPNAGDRPAAALRQRRRGRLGGQGPGGLTPNAPPNPQNRRRGLNENYGRELMELHTLGVDGGYTQKDVTEVARAFTGWTIAQPRQGGGYRFDPRMHDGGEKVVLGHAIKAGGGERDGEAVLDILARHPSTARFIATKLARRFVADEPPPTLIDRAAKRFLETGGDLREVVRLIITSPEMFAPDAYRAKVKTPLEFVASALRATDARIENARPAINALRTMGMPLYMCQPPTGYSDKADAWVNSGALLNRMNFALALVNEQLRGADIDLDRLAAAGDLEGARQQILASLLGNDVSDATAGTIAKATTVAQVTALSLGAPEFQRR
jgi:uncharacterized protein (DUF1800 family)